MVVLAEVREAVGGSGGRIWIFIATPSQYPSMSVVKHGKQGLDNHRRARSRPKYSDDFSNEFEIRRRIDALLFPIGKICRRITEFTGPLCRKAPIAACTQTEMP